jgi:hypothetical protein
MEARNDPHYRVRVCLGSREVASRLIGKQGAALATREARHGVQIKGHGHKQPESWVEVRKTLSSIKRLVLRPTIVPGILLNEAFLQPLPPRLTPSTLSGPRYRPPGLSQRPVTARAAPRECQVL